MKISLDDDVSKFWDDLRDFILRNRSTIMPCPTPRYNSMTEADSHRDTLWQHLHTPEAAG